MPFGNFKTLHGHGPGAVFAALHYVFEKAKRQNVGYLTGGQSCPTNHFSFWYP
jgi:hypothetical protein